MGKHHDSDSGVNSACDGISEVHVVHSALLARLFNHGGRHKFASSCTSMFTASRGALISQVHVPGYACRDDVVVPSSSCHKHHHSWRKPVFWQLTKRSNSIALGLSGARDR